MHVFTLWRAFVGTWLLVAGAIFQVFLELRDDRVTTDRLTASKTTVAPLPSVTRWWWLVPPFRLVRDARRRRRHRDMFVSSLGPDDRETLEAFVNGARGWFLVATGGLLIALGTSYSLTTELGLGTLVYWFALIAALSLCVLNTALRCTVLDSLLRMDAPGR